MVKNKWRHNIYSPHMSSWHGQEQLHIDISNSNTLCCKLLGWCVVCWFIDSASFNFVQSST